MTKRERTRQVVLDQLSVHERDGTLPTTGRFLFYELEQRGEATKPDPNDRRPNKRRSLGWPPGSQDITDALTALRDEDVIPWDWLVDTERSAAVFSHAPTVAEYMLDRLDEATINPWPGPPPLILCEDRGTAEVLERVAAAYACPIAGTKGNANGFLRALAGDLLDGEDRRRDVIYLGDLDRCGEDIERNSRRVISCSGIPWMGEWRRLALTEQQVSDYGITPMERTDGRDGEVRGACELQALGQAELARLLRAELDGLLPEPLASVHEREREQRDTVRRLLEP